MSQLQHHEVELKLEAGEPIFRDLLRHLARRHRFAVGPQVIARHRDAYLDSADWWLYRAGASLRARHADGGLRLSLKLLDPPHDGIADRVELEQRVPGRR